MTNLYIVFHKYKLQGQNVRKSGQFIFRDKKSNRLPYHNPTWILIFKIAKR